MFVWRKRASAPWLAANEMALDKIAGERLTIVSKPAQKNTIAEIASSNRDELEKICKGFGGVIEKLPRDWLQKFLRRQKSKPLKIGSQLIIVSSGKSNSGTLVIPATAAFGTGEHPTTVMSLCLLERLTRIWGAQTVSRPVLGARRNFRGNSVSSASCRGSQAGRLRFPEREFTLLDLGTGTGILALAAKRFGAGKVIAIDNDPVAIATAKENARRNKIERVDFTLADVRQWRFPVRIDIVTANLFGELLIQILPKLKSAQWLILSGVLRQQEARLIRALNTNRIAVVEKQRRGKWVAFLASSPATVDGFRGGKFKVTWRDPSSRLGTTKQGKIFDAIAANPHFLRLRRLRFHL